MFKFLFRLYLFSFTLVLFSELSLSSVFATMTTTRFLYDGDGARVAKIEGGKVILYGSNFEKDLSTGITTKYYASGKKQVAVKTNDSFSYLINDHHGSVTLTTTQNGSINSSSSYYPFGEYRTLSRIGSSRSYISQIKDVETDLYFLNTRYYNQKNGVFTSPDKVYDPQVKNRYAYTAGNPVAMADPSGQCIGPLVFLLSFCIQVAGIMTVDTGIALMGAGAGAIIGGILEQGVNSQVNEPGSSDYQTGVMVGQVGEASGWFMVGAGLTFLERGSISSNATTRASPSKASGVGKFSDMKKALERQGIKVTINPSLKGAHGTTTLQDGTISIQVREESAATLYHEAVHVTQYRKALKLQAELVEPLGGWGSDPSYYNPWPSLEVGQAEAYSKGALTAKYFGLNQTQMNEFIARALWSDRNIALKILGEERIQSLPSILPFSTSIVDEY